MTQVPRPRPLALIILDGFGDSSPARDPNNAEAHLLRGLIEKAAGQRVAALADFEAARMSRPDMVDALIQVGVMKLEAGNVIQALPLLETAVRYAPNAALAHLNLGDAYRLDGRRDRCCRRRFDRLGVYVPRGHNVSANAAPAILEGDITREHPDPGLGGGVHSRAHRSHPGD